MSDIVCLTSVFVGILAMFTFIFHLELSRKVEKLELKIVVLETKSRCKE
jgi:hypothetical protein